MNILAKPATWYTPSEYKSWDGLTTVLSLTWESPYLAKTVLYWGGTLIDDPSVTSSNWSPTYHSGLPIPSTRDPFPKRFMSSQWKFWENYLQHNYDSGPWICSQICPCNDSWVVMECAKLLPDKIVIFQERTTWIWTRFGLWAHKTFVKWAFGVNLVQRAVSLWGVASFSKMQFTYNGLQYVFCYV